MPIRRNGRWMYPTDERILEKLSESSWETPKTMARKRRFRIHNADEAYIRRRCEKLVKHELIAPAVEDSEMYEITSWGLAYLRGDLDAGTLERHSVG